MRHIFGFVDDYSKVIYGIRDTLQLIRKDDNDALFRTADGKVVLSKPAWSVPIVQSNDARKVNLYKNIGIMSFPYRFVCGNVKHSLYI